jgi:hypothetical protein
MADPSNSDSQLPLVPGKCGVCQRELSGAGLLMCSKCKALYHPECWTYNGGRCAIFGCQPAEKVPQVSEVNGAHTERVIPSPSQSRSIEPGTTQGGSASTGHQSGAETSGSTKFLGLLVSGVGLVPGFAIWDALSKGRHVLDALYFRPLTCGLDLALASFPIIWVLSFSTELRGYQRRIATFGGIVLVIWFLLIFSKLNSPFPTFSEGGSYAASTKKASAAQVQSAPEPEHFGKLREEFLISDLRLSGFKWRKLQGRSPERDEQLAYYSGYTHWAEFFLENTSQRLDAVRVVARLRFNDAAGRTIETPEIDVLLDGKSPSTPGMRNRSISAGQYLFFQVPVIAPTSAETCAITIIDVEGVQARK